MPKISVIMPVYNCEMYIKEAIESILNQTHTNFEFLIIDDASTDETVSIIKSYTDPRIQLIIKPINSGYTESLNMGLALAEGKYIARMDGDDISLPERFAKQVFFLENQPDVVLCGTLFSIIGSNAIVAVPENHDAIKLALLRGNCIAHPSVMIRKQTLDEFSIVYDVSKEPAEDYDMWVRLISKGSLHNLQEVLLKYRMHNSQVSQKRMHQQLNSALETRLSLLNYLDFEKTPYEWDILMKINKRNEIISFKEIQSYQKIKDKLIIVNAVGFFEINGFKQYLVEIENRILRYYFLKQNSYSPLIYFQYLKVKKKWNSKLTTFNEFKLFVKSVILYNSK